MHCDPPLADDRPVGGPERERQKGVGLLVDPRVLRNRSALRASLLNALATKSFEKISIRALAADAEISYTTFFRHYENKEALLGDLAVDEVRQLHELTVPIYRDVDPLFACEATFQHVEERKAVWSALMAGASVFVREEMLRLGREATSTYKRSWLPDNLGVLLGVSALVEIIGWWIGSNADLPYEIPARIYFDASVYPLNIMSRISKS